MLKGSEPNKIDNWICLLERGTEYEVQLIKSYLDNLGIPCNVLSKRDSSFTQNFGELSMVYLYVPKKFEKSARKALDALNEEMESDHSNDSEITGNET
tara:strand:+ start:9463 stop:9756 length:294 start_codon:yes stop_codon:yes gene_type:complete